MNDSKPSIGFIGLRIMGAPMARDLLAAGHELVVYDIAGERMAALVAAGAPADGRLSEPRSTSRATVTTIT